MTQSQLYRDVASHLNLSVKQVAATDELLSEGATIPFIARYRKEKTGGLDEVALRSLRDRLGSLKELEERRQYILKTIGEQGNLDDELKKAIMEADESRTLEDLYLPYKKKKKTRADKAVEKGLKPLADLIWEQKGNEGNRDQLVASFVNPGNGVENAEQALAGARDIVAERVSQEPDVRDVLRKQLREYGTFVCQLAGEKEKKNDEKGVFETYYDFSCKVKQLKPHQTLAIDRGEREGVLRVKVEVWVERTLEEIDKLLIPHERSLFLEDMEEAITDAWKRLLSPSLERELRSELTETAGEHAINMFAENLQNLLLQPPLDSKVVLGIDPAYRTGCKVAVVDETGRFLEGTTIYPTPPRKEIQKSKQVLDTLIKKYHVDLIAIGNGTGSRETEEVVAELVGELKEKGEDKGLSWLIVNEAGASVYSASEIAREEFPDLDASQRGNISIARRVLDPLAELVKIEPKSIGVGLYQHDVNQAKLSKKLDEVVESCVNHVGVHLNSASAALLNHVSGLGRLISKEVVRYRESIGRFSSRDQLLEVPGLGPFRYEQAAGFLRIPESDNPLDNTAIHPESYEAARKLCQELDVEFDQLKSEQKQIATRLEQADRKKLSESVGVGLPTLELMIENLLKPGRDPRDELPRPAVRRDILTMEDLSPGTRLQGTVRNVVDFGAFVDIGVKVDGLLHISNMRTDGKRVKDVTDEMGVGDVIDVMVEKIDVKRQRISLTRSGL